MFTVRRNAPANGHFKSRLCREHRLDSFVFRGFIALYRKGREMFWQDPKDAWDAEKKRCQSGARQRINDL